MNEHLLPTIDYADYTDYADYAADKNVPATNNIQPMATLNSDRTSQETTEPTNWRVDAPSSVINRNQRNQSALEAQITGNSPAIIDATDYADIDYVDYADYVDYTDYVDYADYGNGSSSSGNGRMHLVVPAQSDAVQQHVKQPPDPQNVPKGCCPRHPKARWVRYDPSGQAWCDTMNCWDAYRLMEIGEALGYRPLVSPVTPTAAIAQGIKAWAAFVLSQSAFVIVLATEQAIALCKALAIEVPDLSAEVQRLVPAT